MPRPGPGAGHRKRTQPKDTIGGVAVHVVEVPYPTGNSGVPLSAPVTMPKAPWEDEGDL